MLKLLPANAFNLDKAKIISFPNEKNKDSFKLREVADDKSKSDDNRQKVLQKGKKKTLRENEKLLLFPQCFKKA